MTLGRKIDLTSAVILASAFIGAAGFIIGKAFTEPPGMRWGMRPFNVGGEGRPLTSDEAREALLRSFAEHNMAAYLEASPGFG